MHIYTFLTAVLIDSMDLSSFFFPPPRLAHSGIAAKHFNFQFSDQRLNYQPLTDTPLLPSYHLGPVPSLSLPRAG